MLIEMTESNFREMIHTVNTCFSPSEKGAITRRCLSTGKWTVENIVAVVSLDNDSIEELGEIDIVQWNTRNNETNGLAQGIKKLIEYNKVPEGEKILVLVPRKVFGIQLKKKVM